MGELTSRGARWLDEAEDGRKLKRSDEGCTDS